MRRKLLRELAPGPTAARADLTSGIAKPTSIDTKGSLDSGLRGHRRLVARHGDPSNLIQVTLA